MPKKRITEKDLKSALPDTESPLRVAGSGAPITVYRDRFGIPHVLAQSVNDAFFGQGFVAAQDRLWQMDTDRRRAYGRLAEVLGESALEADRVMRRFQIGDTVENDYRAVDADTRSMLDAYAAGVNAFAETTDVLPVEHTLTDSAPEPWEPWDCFAVFKVRHIMMGIFEGKLWRARLVNVLGPEKAAELLRGHPPGHMVIVPPGGEYRGPVHDALDTLRQSLEAIGFLREDPDAGSNNWVVHGSRTASGKPLLAGDSHRGLDTPNVYYPNHITCPAFDVIGLSFPGCPGFPHFGHNTHVAWCVTHAQADYQDLYIERFSSDDPAVYEFKGKWKPAEVRQEQINVRNAEPREITLFRTDHGPIIGGDPEKGYGVAFRYTATAAPYRGFECILPMMQAASVEELDRAMRLWVDPCNNLLFADTRGDIAYLHRGQVPIRSAANAWLPVSGWTGEHEWQGNIPFEQLPRLRNPSTGFIVTANNRIADEKYPHYIALNYGSDHRARRIFDRLSAMPRATVRDMQAVHGDCVSIPARVFTRILSRIRCADDFTERARSVLSGWDGRMDAEAVAPTLYSAFRIRLLHRIIGNLAGPLADEMFTATGRGAPRHLSDLTTLLVASAEKNDPSLLPSGTDWSTIAADALDEAVRDLRGRLGDDMDSWRWGKVHRTAPKHPLSDRYTELAHRLNPPDVAMGGDGDTPLAAGFSPANPFEVTLLSVVRYVFDLADWDNSGWSVPLGVSGHPGSPHYADQAPIWANQDLVPMHYSRQRIEAEAVSRQTLEPK